MLIAINDQPKGIAGRMLNFIGDFFFQNQTCVIDRYQVAVQWDNRTTGPSLLMSNKFFLICSYIKAVYDKLNVLFLLVLLSVMLT